VAGAVSRGGTLANSGTAGLFALVFGVAYVSVALLEVILGDDGLHVGDGSNINEIILLRSTPHNLIHWVVGIALLAAFFLGFAKIAARVVGSVFALVTALGLLAPSFTMDTLLDYGPGLSVPIAYTLVHATTAAAGLSAGFVADD
jgi:hypothetical protein